MSRPKPLSTSDTFGAFETGNGYELNWKGAAFPSAPSQLGSRGREVLRDFASQRKASFERCGKLIGFS